MAESSKWREPIEALAWLSHPNGGNQLEAQPHPAGACWAGRVYRPIGPPPVFECEKPRDGITSSGRS